MRLGSPGASLPRRWRNVNSSPKESPLMQMEKARPSLVGLFSEDLADAD